LGNLQGRIFFDIFNLCYQPRKSRKNISEYKIHDKNIGSNCILQNRQLIFSPKIPYNLVAERSEAAASCLQFPVWWCLYDTVRTHFEQNPD